MASGNRLEMRCVAMGRASGGLHRLLAPFETWTAGRVGTATATGDGAWGWVAASHPYAPNRVVSWPRGRATI